MHSNDIKSKLYFLATNGLPESCNTSKPIILLGNWCNNLFEEPLKNNIIDKLDENVYSIHDYEYTIKIYTSLLPKISNWLNKIHKLNYSLKYWKIVIGPFLLWYIQVVYDRLTSLKKAWSSYPDFSTIGLKRTSFKTPINTLEFYLFATNSHAWNLQLFTQIFESDNKVIDNYIDYEWKDEFLQRKKIFDTSIKYKYLTKIKLSIVKYFLNINKKRTIGIYFCGFSNYNLYRLLFMSRFRIFPLIKTNINENETDRTNEPNLELRNQLSAIEVEDKFEHLILQTIKHNFPLNFIEYYHEESKKSEKCLPYSPGLIVASGWNPDDHLKFWGAKKAENGAKIVDIQHGGGYGTHLYSSREYLERENCDAFLSWGWSDDSKTIPTPAISACEKYFQLKKKFNNPGSNQIIWITNEVPPYLISLDSSLDVYNKSFFESMQKFYSLIDSSLLKKIYIRVRPSSKIVNKIKKIAPNLQIYIPETNDSFFDQIKLAKILIFDSLQTTFLYGLSFNIPSVIFTQSGLSKINAYAKPYFNLLKQHGIYHDSPDTAAHTLNTIESNLNDWWTNNELQRARMKFCNQFVKVNKNWLKDWNSILLNLSNKNV